MHLCHSQPPPSVMWVTCRRSCYFLLWSCLPTGSGLRETDGGNLVGAWDAAASTAAHNNEVRYQQISNNHCGLQLLLVPFMNLHSKIAAALLPADSPVAQNQCRKANSGKCNSSKFHVIPVYVPAKEQNENNLRLLLCKFKFQKTVEQ